MDSAVILRKKKNRKSASAHTSKMECERNTMPTIILNKTVLFASLRKRLRDIDLANAIDMLGPDVDTMTQDDVTIEVPPNRPDLLCEQGMARALSSFLGIKTGLRKYLVKKSNQKVIVDDSVSGVRPYTACAIVKGIRFSDATIKQVIQLQEKLHITYGRNRKKCAVGLYPLEHIRPPIRFMAKKSEDIIFAPLDMNKELTGSQILALHPTGREYGKLLEGQKRYPIFIDSRNNVLSMPPIINSNTVGKITEKTHDVFLEVSGFDLEYLNTALCMLTTALADMGGQILSMDVQMKGKRRTTPDFAPLQFKLDVDYVNRRLGTKLSEGDIRKALAKMGHDYNNKTVFSPRWRADLLHPIDLVEEIAIAIGYENIASSAPSIATIGRESEQEMFFEYVRDVLVGQGFFEIKNYHLISESVQTKFVNLHDPLIKLANAFNEEYATLRRSLLPGTLLTFKENKNAEYPQAIFEIGTIFREDEKQETHVSEQSFLSIALSDANTGFTRMKQVLMTLADAFAVSFEMKEGNHSAMVEGRTGIITIRDEPVGILGEIHPAVLENFSLDVPVGYLELDLNVFQRLLKKGTTQPSQEKRAKK